MRSGTRFSSGLVLIGFVISYDRVRPASIVEGVDLVV